MPRYVSACLRACYVCTIQQMSHPQRGHPQRGNKRVHSNERPASQSQSTHPAPAKRCQPGSEPSSHRQSLNEQIRSTVSVVSNSQPTHASLSQPSTSSASSSHVRSLISFNEIRVPRISDRAGQTSHAAQQRQLSTSTSTSSHASSTDFMPAQVSHSLKPEYGNLAMRGTLVQSRKGGVPIQLPNKYGYLLDGSQEPMSLSSAPVAR